MSVRQDARARLSGPPGVIEFPVTPTVSTAGSASYSEYDVTHTNYSFPAYQKSTIDDISVDAIFYSDTIALAEQTLDAIRFVRAAIKMDFNGSGAPPPVLRFSYLGQDIFSDVPCVMVSYNISFQNDVDYVEVGANWLPMELTITTTLRPVYSPQKQASEWNWGGFASGGLIRRGYL